MFLTLSKHQRTKKGGMASRSMSNFFLLGGLQKYASIFLHVDGLQKLVRYSSLGWPHKIHVPSYKYLLGLLIIVIRGPENALVSFRPYIKPTSEPISATNTMSSQRSHYYRQSKRYGLFSIAEYESIVHFTDGN